MNKKHILILAIAALLLTGCNTKKDTTAINSSATSETTTANTSSSSSEASTSSAESSTTAATSSAEPTKTALWSPEKAQALADFMVSWQASMGQSYQSFRPGQNTNLYGLQLPDSILDGTWTMAVDEQPVQVQWSETGEGTAPYQLVAVYSDADHAAYLQAHVYFFVIQAGQPRVLITMQNQGNEHGYLYFSETENVDLKNGFAEIVNNGAVAAVQPVSTAITSFETAHQLLQERDNHDADLAYNGMEESSDQHGRYWQIKVSSKSMQAGGGTGSLAQVRVYENGDVRDAFSGELMP